MATIIKREVKGKKYNYLSHSYREDDKVLKIEKYLGREIPTFEELVNIWEEFSYKIINIRWIDKINKIIENYRKTVKKIPDSIKVKELENFGIRFTHHTNKIEGSTLSLRNVQKIIEDNITPKDKPVNEVIETKSHDKVYHQMLECNEELSVNLLCEWHKELFQLTNHNIAGVIRDYPVSITGTDYEPPTSKYEIELLLGELFEWYNENKEKYNPIFVAAIMHYRFVAIHPFGDGNGRMGRLVMTYILYKNNVAMFFIDSKLRDQYLKALERSDKKDFEFPFIQWFFQSYIKHNKKYLEIPGKNQKLS